MENLNNIIESLKKGIDTFISDNNSEKLSTKNLVELAKLQNDTKQKIDDIKGAVTLLTSFYELLRKHHVPNAMEAQGIKNISIDGVGQIVNSKAYYVSIESDRQEDAYNWLRDNGHGLLIKETVNNNSLRALLTDYINNGGEINENIFRVHEYQVTKITKRNK
jgi:hypothetical protein